MRLLQEIITHKRKEVKLRRKRVNIKNLHPRPASFLVLDYKASLAQNGIQVIAEIKRKSPSAGNIFKDADPVAVAVEYEKQGAAAISVLTDKHYFDGSLEFLTRIKASVSIPVMQKDFIISEYQIMEAYHAGADAILLIADALNDVELKYLYDAARGLGLAVLVEVHDRNRLSGIKALNPEIVGVNARNLATMAIDLRRFGEFKSLLPDRSLNVAESGITTSRDLINIQALGYDAALVGTTLMRRGTPGKSLNELLTGTLE